jgi:ribonuclease PH
MVLCTCCVEATVPPFLVGTGKGWLTAEYSMLPGSTATRKARDKAGKVDGRSVEIQRLIGRSLRAVVDLDRLGERTLWIDCDVLEADGGTRTASINGAFVALVDALAAMHAAPPRVPRTPGTNAPGSPSSVANPSGSLMPFPSPADVVRGSAAAVSIGVLAAEVLLDLCYVEDRDADVDLNLVMTGAGEFIEVQAGGEEATFSRDQLDRLLAIGAKGIADITVAQQQALGERWPLAPK